MKSRHITKILDRTPFAELSESDLATISTHNADCQSCAQAVKAAHISSAVLKVLASAAASFEPSPYFQAKVLNALRERQNLRSPMAAFRRWWQASATMVMVMVMTVVGLGALNAFAPPDAEQTQAEVSNFNLYSTDAVILNQNPTRDLTNEQVFEVIYAKSDSER